MGEEASLVNITIKKNSKESSGKRNRISNDNVISRGRNTTTLQGKSFHA